VSAGERTKVGFVGLGTMGWPMSANIARGGFDVVGIDADPELAKRWAAEHGGTAASGPQDFADVGVVVTMLPTGAIVRQAILDGGIADALPDGAVVVDMSSAEPSATLSLAPELESRGVGLVDAPVSGARTKAIDGTLTIMLGGEDEAAIEKVTPVLETMSANIFRTGPLGSGHAMKALNNYVGGAGFVAACEALVVGTKFGLDPAVMIDIINVSTGRNFTTQVAAPTEILPRRFASGFSLALFTKDIGIAADLADELDVDAPVSRLVFDRMKGALDQLDDVVDHSMALTIWEQAAGVTVAPHERTS
jgi:3-hydroxyisobutyrate dehydrogenase